MGKKCILTLEDTKEPAVNYMLSYLTQVSIISNNQFTRHSEHCKQLLAKERVKRIN